MIRPARCSSLYLSIAGSSRSQGKGGLRGQRLRGKDSEVRRWNRRAEVGKGGEHGLDKTSSAGGTLQ